MKLHIFSIANELNEYMNKNSLLLLLLIAIFSCNKSNNSTQPPDALYGQTSYSVNIKLGSTNYYTSNTSVYQMLNQEYQFDNSAIFNIAPACYLTHLPEGPYQVLVDDTANRAMAPLVLLNFLIPSVKSFSSPVISVIYVYFNHVTYVGYANITGEISSDNNKSVTGSFKMSGNVLSGNSTDSVPFSATQSFTNMPY